MTRGIFVLLVIGFVIAGCASTPAPTPRDTTTARRPPVVVVLVVDQMRSEYLETLGPRFTAGFRRVNPP